MTTAVPAPPFGSHGLAGPPLWHDTLPPDELLTPRPALDGSTQADVAIVGAGYTGLWTAYYLLAHDPTLRVVVLEREVAGFGASGRNGGWCSSLFPVSLEKLASRSSRDDAVRMQRAADATVDEVAAVVAAEGIDAQLAKGGTISLARSPLQLTRAHDEVAHARSWGFGESDVRFLDAVEARGVLNATDTLGAVLRSHCAALHPARLVRGLARAVEARGGRLVEGTPVTEIGPGAAVTPFGTVQADVVVRATEGYTAGLPGHERAVAPVYSVMIATAPLPADVWDDIGLAQRTTFNDQRHMVIYGQRTADGRFAFGGRGAPYRFGSRVSPAQEDVPEVFAWLHRTLVDLVPEVHQVEVTHRWAGPLGIARDWWPSVGLDRGRGLAWAGGYVGDGVAASNLAGRTIADLVLGRDTDIVTLPWVNHRSPRWEPEPLRWLGLNAGLTAMGWADPEEQATGRTSLVARAFGRLMHG
jgi:glycine/D-amino acid oxidase-like deaminating enzyme